MAPPLSVFSHTNPRSANQLFKEAVSQVSQFLPRCQTCAATSRVLADYFLRDIPEVGGLPFGVALSHATILYHLKLHRPSMADLENILGLLSTIVSIAPERAIRNCDSYFFEEVVRGAILGLPPSRQRVQQRRSGNLLPPVAHHVVLLPSNVFDSFNFMACNLMCNPRLDALRREWLNALQPFTEAPSVLVSLRTRIIALRCNPRSAREHAAEVIQAVSASPEALPAEAVALVFDHLRFAVNINEQDRTVEEHALCIGASRILLELQSTCRRNFVENYLYPALHDPRMEAKLRKPETSAHLGQQLLRLMCAGNPTCPYYLSCCALFQRMLCDTPLRGARFLVVLCQLVMPEGAQFVALLSSDAQMNADYIGKTVSEIIEGVAQVADYTLENNDQNEEGENNNDNNNNNNNNNHRGRPPFERDSVAYLLHQGGSTLMVKTLFMIRLIVSSIVHSPEAALGFNANANNGNNGNLFARGNTVSQQAHRRELILVALRTSLNRDTLQLFTDYVDQCLPNDQSTLSPDVLITEMGMTLHSLYLDDTINRVREFIAEQLTDKDNSPAATDDTVISAMNRVVLAIAESANARYRLATETATWLRHDPLDPATHVTLLAVMSRCTSSTRSEMFDLVYNSLVSYVLPAVRNNLIAPEEQQRRTIDNARIRDCEGASSALVFVTRLLLMVRHGSGSSSSSSSNNNEGFSPLAKRLCVDLAMIGASLARSVVRGQVGLVLWWSTLSLLRFGGEKSTVALSSQNIGLPSNRDGAANNNNNRSGNTSRNASSSRGNSVASSGNNNNVTRRNAIAAAAEDRQAYTHLFTALRYVHMQFPKLVGLAVSRLIMDFCLHAPIIVENIVSSLDEHYHNNNNNNNNGDHQDDEKTEIALLAEARAEHFSLSLRDDSPFRKWLNKQILRSVPSRTSLIITYAQCVASRVRVHPEPLRLLLSANTDENNNTDEEYLQLSLARERTFSDLLLKTIQSDRNVGDMFCNSTCAWIRGDACPKMTTPGPFLMVIGALLSLRYASPPRARAKIQESLGSQLPKVVTVAETLNQNAVVNSNVQHGGVSFGFANFASALVSLTRGDQAIDIPVVYATAAAPEQHDQQQQQQQPLNHGQMNNNNNNDYDYNGNDMNVDDDDMPPPNDDFGGYDDNDDSGYNNNNNNNNNVTSSTSGNSNNNFTLMNQTDMSLQQQQQPLIDQIRQQQQQQQHRIYSQSAAPLREPTQQQQQNLSHTATNIINNNRMMMNNNTGDENTVPTSTTQINNTQQQQQSPKNGSGGGEMFDTDIWKAIRGQGASSLLYEIRAAQDFAAGGGSLSSPIATMNMMNQAEMLQQLQQQNQTPFSQSMMNFHSNNNNNTGSGNTNGNNNNNNNTTTTTINRGQMNSIGARDFGTAQNELRQMVNGGGMSGNHYGGLNDPSVNIVDV